MYLSRTHHGGTSIGTTVGADNFARKLIPHFAVIVELRVALMHREVARRRALHKFWTVRRARGLVAIKHPLATAPVMHSHQLDQEFIVHMDTSDLGVEAIPDPRKKVSMLLL